ncbi:DciA family protein [Streptomyces misionensis]|uniref:DciA family protein n=1 Tax=Streptomyces misionensis TaxID=67331 RepID=UPI00396B70EE
MTSTQPSGVDLARAALAAARAAAKTRPTQPTKKAPRSRRETRRGGRDPMALGAAVAGLMTDRGWEPPEPGGSILDQWPTIAPELASKVTAVRFEHDTGTLHLRPISPAYATQLRLHQAQILTRIHEKTGARTVRQLRILAPGETQAAREPEPQTVPLPEAEAPVRTRETAPAGYRQARALLREHRLGAPMADPREEAARQRQIAAARANRLPASEDREAMWAQDAAAAAAGPMPGSMEASERAALIRKRQEQAGLVQPRRALDVA